MEIEGVLLSTISFDRDLLGRAIYGKSLIVSTAIKGNDSAILLTALINPANGIVNFSIRGRTIRGATRGLLLTKLASRTALLRRKRRALKSILTSGTGVNNTVFGLKCLPKSSGAVVAGGGAAVHTVRTLLPGLQVNDCVLLIICDKRPNNVRRGGTLLSCYDDLGRSLFGMLRCNFVGRVGRPPFLVTVRGGGAPCVGWGGKGRSNG